MRVHANRATRHERQRMRAVLSDLRRDRQGEANSGEASVEEEVSLAQLCRRLTLTLTLTLTSPSPSPNPNPNPYQAIADANLRALRRALPVAFRTVNYLSGDHGLTRG